MTELLQDDRFRLLKVLGRGGMGTVYRAYDLAAGRVVALKVPSHPARCAAIASLTAEFDTWSRLRHPNIVRAYELAVAANGPLPDGTPYLVLEHVPGRPELRTRRAGRMRPAEVGILAAQTLSALVHVHEAGFVHRDLKPGNVLASVLPGRAVRYKLTDFGLATRIGNSNPLGTFSGSLPYVAPEALLGLPLDGRADLYGLGIVLFRLATGETPVPRGGAPEILRWHLTGPAPDPTRVRPALSACLCRFLRRMTRRDRDDRPRSASCALRLLGISPEAVRPRRSAWPDPPCSIGSSPPDALEFA